MAQIVEQKRRIIERNRVLQHAIQQGERALVRYHFHPGGESSELPMILTRSLVTDTDRRYVLIDADLRDVAKLHDTLIAHGLDVRYGARLCVNNHLPTVWRVCLCNALTCLSLPTLVITECVLVYLPSDVSNSIVRWAGATFQSCLFINFEQASCSRFTLII